MKVTRVGLDIAKLVSKVHGVDEHEKQTLRKQLARTKVLEFFANLPLRSRRSSRRFFRTWRRRPRTSTRPSCRSARGRRRSRGGWFELNARRDSRRRVRRPAGPG